MDNIVPIWRYRGKRLLKPSIPQVLVLLDRAIADGHAQAQGSNASFYCRHPPPTFLTFCTWKPVVRKFSSWSWIPTSPTTTSRLRGLIEYAWHWMTIRTANLVWWPLSSSSSLLAMELGRSVSLEEDLGRGEEEGERSSISPNKDSCTTTAYIIP